MKSSKHFPLSFLLATGLLASAATAQVTFTFETPGQLADHSEVSGDIDQWVESTDQALTGTSALKVSNDTQQSFRSFTYDVPMAMDEGTISLWFYDTVGAGAPYYEWGMSIILESESDPSDFGAVEIVRTHGADVYRGSEGSVDRLAAPDKFDSASFPARSIGWHQIVFTVSAASTSVSIDGSTSTEIAAPGSGVGDLRLRIMADSASAGGSSNWTSASAGFPAAPGVVFIDEVVFAASAPAVVTDTLDFEDTDVTGLGNGSGDPEYDRIGVFMGPAAFNEPNLRGFVNAFDVQTTHAHSGTNGVGFANGEPLFRNIVIDLTSATPGTITIPFYDSLGPDQGFDKIGGAFIIEDGSDPTNFIAAEIWNAPYPSAETDKNYYLTTRPAAFGAGFHSGYFGDRATGWQTLQIELTNTYSRITINGAGADTANGGAVYDGPGLNTNPKLRIMADSPSLGGFGNWQDDAGWTDPETPELDALYLEKGATYLFLDDIVVPLPASTGVEDWMSYE